MKTTQTMSLSLLALSVLAASNAAFAVNCTSLETWNSSKAYSGGAQVQLEQKAYKANWWNQNKNPSQFSNAYQD